VLWKEIGAKVRNLVRKAEKSDLTVREGDPARDLDGFYDVFAENMRELGTPVYAKRFFREVFREFPDSLRLTVVEAGSRLVASGICIRDGGFTEIHWAASSRDYLRYSPNMALYWEAISHAADQGLTEFCFGRSTEDSGPYRFKKQWGAQPTRLRWEYLLPEGGGMPGLNPDNPKFRLATRVWQKLPLPVTRLLGPPIVRHLP
jgi:FemAB-related protein (PEP-CTERM system-associated)